MAQLYIKIFDDTVLKQSVNQGYEVQRTNSRLGKFTMGELAFTRDTGRLFVGNFTNLNEPKDSNFVTGGILTGNKYLGIIDSKPLTHWNNKTTTNENNESVLTSTHLPLSYTHSETVTFTELTPDGDVISTDVTEEALLGTNSKFRTDKNTKNSGWNKESIYNETYDAYNGDYMYDVYNNAFIFFDKNIVPDDVNAIKWKNTNRHDADITEETEDDTLYHNQYFQKPDGSYYTETTGDLSSKRTPILNVPDSQESNEQVAQIGNPKYPIYGNGYVVMRILEPDGITLGYKEREFNQDDGIPTDNNYSHNYIEIKDIPINILFKSFDSTQFSIDGGEISFTGGGDKPLQINEIISVDSNGNPIHLTIPNEVVFKKHGDVESDASTMKINFNNDTSYNYDVDGIINFLTLKTVAGTTNEYDAKIVQPPTLNITVNGISKSESLSPGRTIELNFDEAGEGDVEHLFIFDPFRVFTSDGIQKSSGNYAYSGNFTYDTLGRIQSFEEIIDFEYPEDGEDYSTLKDVDGYALFSFYDSTGDVPEPEEKYIKIQESENENGDIIYEEIETTPDDEDGERQLISHFKHPYLNTGLNYLRKPQPFAWGIGSYKAQFFIHPFVCSPKNYYFITEGLDEDGEIIDIEELIDDNLILNEGDGACVGKIGIDTLANNWPTTYKLDSNSEQYAIFIPDHASSIICEVHIDNSKSYSLVTSAEYSTYPTLESLSAINGIVDLSSISETSFPAFAEEYIDNLKILYNKDDLTQSPNKFIIELPLYRNKDSYKFFSFAMYATGNWVMRAIGYRA